MTPIAPRGALVAPLFALASTVLFAAEPKLPWGYPDSTSTSGQRAQDTVLAITDPKIPMQLALPSPDGRYAFTWPNAEQAGKRNGELDNMLVDVKAAKPIFRVDSGKSGDYEGKNHGGLEAVWRADSGAVILFTLGKWSPDSVRVLVFDADAKVASSEVMKPLRQELLKIFKAQAPKFTQGLDAEGFGVQIGCEFSADGKTVEVMALGETNGKMISGEPRVVAELGGTFDPASQTLTVTRGKVTEAKILKEE